MKRYKSLQYKTINLPNKLQNSILLRHSSEYSKPNTKFETLNYDHDLLQRKQQVDSTSEVIKIEVTLNRK